MDKFEKRPEVIEADIYKEGMEDGFAYDIDGAGLLTETEALEGGYSVEDREKIPYVNADDPFVGKVKINTGDYVTINPNGSKRVWSPDEFEILYKKVE